MNAKSAKSARNLVYSWRDAEYKKTSHGTKTVNGVLIDVFTVKLDSSCGRARYKAMKKAIKSGRIG